VAAEEAVVRNLNNPDDSHVSVNSNEQSGDGGNSNNGSGHGARGPYAVNTPQPQPTTEYQTPLFQVWNFHMTQLQLHHSPHSVVPQLVNVIVPPSYCHMADHNNAAPCRMLCDRYELLTVLHIPLPILIEIPAYCCTTHLKKGKRNVITHWFSHEYATKVKHCQSTLSINTVN
jgi:hypothetical protein